ncbi:histidinol dehydrogenase [Aureococcus anophagefferens]|nr:histidinol dehydrogenase [Aureococcus anophagefferens]
MGVKIVEASSVNAGDSETLDTKVMEFAEQCLAKVKAEGAPAVYAYAGQFGELTEGQSAVVDKAAMKAAYDGLDADDRACLEASGARIKAFALAQKASFVDMETPIPGGVAGHTTVAVATPKPLPVTLAAAHVAGADVLVAVGGAHAIAAMATGARRRAAATRALRPGNAWVTAAKACAATSARVGIDMIAGPSEVLVICDETADAATVASGHARAGGHDVVTPIVVAFSSDGSGKAGALKMVAKINAALDAQLENLLTKAVAAPRALGAAVACGHGRLRHRPNHTPGVRHGHTGGLCVMDFLRIRTWMRIDDGPASQCAVRDAVRLAHRGPRAARAARRLLPPPAKKQKV